MVGVRNEGVSGVVAVYRPAGRPSTDRFERLLSTLDYRGPDGRDRWVGDGVAVGHQQLWTTPQSVGQSQPVVVDDAVVALAGRLDGRDRLAPALPAGTALDGTADPVLLGHAYREWGPACLDRALGAFGAVVWDRDRRRLLVARDKTGIRHVFVAVGDDGVVVGSDATTVRAHPTVPGGPADPSLAAYLADREASDDAAFYEGVRRLPAGTRLVADADGTRTERYWHPADAGTAGWRGRLARRWPGGTDPATRIRTAVRAAVADRLRGVDRPGVLLSGGVDSTAVAGVAAADLDAAPPAFSMVFEAVDDERLTREERARIRDVAGAHDLPLSAVVVDDAGPLSDPAAFDGPLAEGPCLDPTQPAVDRLLDEVADAGRRTVLTGHGGNVFDGSRFAYADLLRRGRLATLLRQARRDPLPTRRVLKWYALAPAVPRLAARLFDVGSERPPPWLGPRSRRCDTGSRTAPERFRSVYRQRDYAALTGLRRDHKVHTGHRRAARRGLVMRLPLLDARVVAAAYTAPTHELCAAGERKALFRDAFADVLPASVLAVESGRHFEAPVAGGLARRAAHLRSVLDAPRLEARGYVADGAATERLAAFLDGDADWLVPWRLFAAERWLAALDD